MKEKPNGPESADNWEAQIRKGWLELAILATLWDGKHYGLEILRRLEQSSDLIVAEGTIYPILARLKGAGLVASEWVESESGHPRKYYWLTPTGRRRAAAMAGFGLGFLEKIGSLLEPLASEEQSR
jgi:PadR family transcriptional regulator PadR